MIAHLSPPPPPPPRRLLLCLFHHQDPLTSQAIQHVPLKVSPKMFKIVAVAATKILPSIPSQYGQERRSKTS
jgi:hypothetical protein